MGQPLQLLKTTIVSDWIDYNGHLYDGHYAVIFSKAVDELLVKVGLDAATRDATRRTIYTLETHVRFLREVKLGRTVAITAQVFEIDGKRARVFLEMHDGDVVAATSEQLLMSIDQSGDVPRSAPWLEASAAILAGLRDEHAGLAVPDCAGRGIALRR